MKLILVCGLQGTGKTTVAEKIAEKTGALLFSTDAIRKDLISEPKYTEKEKKLVYGLMFDMAEKFLNTVKDVVLDGTFYRKVLRDRVRDLAKKTGSDFHLVEVVCSEETVKQRMREREKRKSLSDADFRVYKKTSKQFQPVKGKHITVDTDKDWNKQLERVFTTELG